MDVTQADVDRARKIAHWYSRRTRRADPSDLESAALEGLACAVDRFDGTDKRRFWSYAATRIIGAIRDELRRLDHLTRDQRAAIREGDDGVFTIDDAPWLNPEPPLPLDARPWVVSQIPDPRDHPREVDDREALKRALATLTKRERDILLAVDYVGLPNLEMADRMGITQGRATQIRSEASAKIRAALGTDFPLAA